MLHRTAATWSKLRLLLLLAVAGSLALAADDSMTTGRREFMRAYAMPDATARDDSQGLRDYVLYPYLQAARLQQALKPPLNQTLNQPRRDMAQVDQDIRSFLLVQRQQPVVRGLRRVWLLDLASRQQWQEFLEHFPAGTSDAELRCWNATAMLATQSTTEQRAALQSVLATLWLSGARLPEACNAPFVWARTNNVITAAMIEQRARLALQAGNAELARELAVDLPREQAEPIRQWAVLINKPLQAIDALIANPDINVESLALQDGWLRLARKDVDAALARFDSLIRARGFTSAAASPYAMSLALSLAWSRRSETLAYFARVQPGDLTDQAHEWHARAALRVGRWQVVKQVIGAMPEALRAQARWRYWLARAHQQLNELDTARGLYQTLVANDDNYFAAMAAARLKVSYAPHVQVIANDAALAAQLREHDAMQRIRELLSVKLRDEATAEWMVAFGGWSREQQLAAARLIAGWGWHEQMVAVTARMGLYNDYELLYPTPYDDAVNAAASLSKLSADLIYAQMRQESLFRADAVSSANARGLMQLLPATARSTARQFKLPSPALEDLFNPVINVPLGAVHLKSLIDNFDGQVVLALAAYNAGSGAARRWLPSSTMDSDIWIENIPYNETRAYVQRILWHSLVFHWLREGKSLDTTAWLAQLRP